MVGKNQKLDGVIVTCPVDAGRVKLGAQVVIFLVDKGFIGGGDKWKNVILAGTKCDKVQDDDIQWFKDEVVEELFRNSPSKTGTCAMVHHED